MHGPHGRFTAPSPGSNDIERHRRERDANQHVDQRCRDGQFVYAEISDHHRPDLDDILIHCHDRRGVRRCVTVPRIVAALAPSVSNVVAMTRAEIDVFTFADAGGVIDYTETA